MSILIISVALYCGWILFSEKYPHKNNIFNDQEPKKSFEEDRIEELRKWNNPNE